MSSPNLVRRKQLHKMPMISAPASSKFLRQNDGNAPVSVLIPAFNEEANIEACIKSVQWAGEIIVVDSGSVDNTREMASRLGARVVRFNYVPAGPKKKNWALANVDFDNDWLLILDAD